MAQSSPSQEASLPFSVTVMGSRAPNFLLHHFPLVPLPLPPVTPVYRKLAPTYRVSADHMEEFRYGTYMAVWAASRHGMPSANNIAFQRMKTSAVWAGSDSVLL